MRHAEQGIATSSRGWPLVGQGRVTGADKAPQWGRRVPLVATMPVSATGGRRPICGGLRRAVPPCWRSERINFHGSATQATIAADIVAAAQTSFKRDVATWFQRMTDGRVLWTGASVVSPTPLTSLFESGGNWLPADVTMCTARNTTPTIARAMVGCPGTATTG
jgi:hypothetical protein